MNAAEKRLEELKNIKEKKKKSQKTGCIIFSVAILTMTAVLIIIAYIYS